MPWGYWLPLLLRGVDIRTLGSGNPGATNVWRTLGFKFGIAVALLDIAKGAAAALLGLWLGGDLVGVLAGVAAMIGHWRPLFLGFARGGKIVATTGGVALALAPLAALSAAAVWLAIFFLTRYASVASIFAADLAPALGASVRRFLAGRRVYRGRRARHCRSPPDEPPPPARRQGAQGRAPPAAPRRLGRRAALEARLPS